MSALIARTLVEAHTYLSLLAAADGDTEEQSAAATVTTEGDRSWTLSYRNRVEVEVPYDSEQAARAVGARFGLGRSRLVDAGQWVLVAQTYAERAVQATVRSGSRAVDPEQIGLELNWVFAADALDEALKFLDDGGSAFPDPAFWTDQGRRLAAEQPELLTRAKLVEDLGYYRGALDDLRSRHGR
jgi:hypothetical protein